MRAWLLEWLDQHIGFYGHHRWYRFAVIGVLLALAIVCGYRAQIGDSMPASAITSVICSALLIALLLLDSVYFLFFFYGYSRRLSLMLIRRIDSNLDFVIKKVITYLETVPADKLACAILSESEEVKSDFITSRPQRRILLMFLSHTMINFIATIASFAIITANVTLLNRHRGSTQPTYKHDCCLTGQSYSVILLHSFYYHTVIFQSLGDGDHAPQTTSAQSIATIEAFVSLTYLILMFGGSLSVVSYLDSELSPGVIQEELRREFTSMSARRTSQPLPGVFT